MTDKKLFVALIGVIILLALPISVGGITGNNSRCLERKDCIHLNMRKKPEQSRFMKERQLKSA